MTEPESVTQVRAGSETSRGKGGKGKAVIKRSKSETPSGEQPEQAMEGRQPDRAPAPARSRKGPTRDPQVTAKIQQRAYGLFEAGGFQHGHDMEHWLEAERQITGSRER
jgi:hypothetical protein